MATLIKIKRSEVSGNPTVLAAGELAYSALEDNGSNGGDRLYIGSGTETNGDAANHVVIGGKFFTDKLDHTPGTLTASSAVIVDANSKIDIFKVDNIQLDANTISTTDANGNLVLSPNGEGKVSIATAYTLPRTDGTIGQVLVTNGSGSVTFQSPASSSFTIAGGTGTDTFNTGETLTFEGGNLITTTVTDNKVNIAASSTIALQTDTTYVGTTAVALNRTSANQALTGISSVALPGSTSGTITVQPTAIAGTNTLTLPAITGTVITSGDTGTVTNTMLAGSIANSKLSNSSISINSSSTSLGGSVTLYAGTTTLQTSSANQALTGISSVALPGSTSGTITLQPVAAAGTNTITLPAATGTVALNTNNLSVFAATTSAQLAGVISDETGTGALVFASSPTLTTPNIGAATATSITSTAALSLNAGGTNETVNIVPTGTGTVDVATKRITNVATPISASDAANKGYVDSAITGLDWKEAAHLLSTTNVALAGSTSTLIIDGHAALDSGDTGYRILLIGQTISSDNGIYIYSDNGTTYTLTRTTDADTFEELIGASVFVMEGTTYAQTGWVQTNHYLTAFTGQSWVQFSGSGAYVAGAGLTLTGTTFDVSVAASGGIEISSDALQLKSTLAGDGLTLTSGVLAVGGTTNRITISADAIDIASTYVGQTSITTLGTIATGTWSATTIAADKGGTGQSSYAVGDILVASSTSALGKLAIGTNGKVLQSNGTTLVYADIDGGTY